MIRHTQCRTLLSRVFQKNVLQKSLSALLTTGLVTVCVAIFGVMAFGPHLAKLAQAQSQIQHHTPTPVPSGTPGTGTFPPTATPITPTIAPTATDVPPTATEVPPTATEVPPTATEVPPTATDVPPTATEVPPTATDVPPTATDVPPTATDIPPTATDVPPTATEVPPTATPTNTPTPPPGTLTVTKVIQRQGGSGTIGQPFQICIQGPSYPTGNGSGACKTFTEDGQSQTWTGLIPGSYTVTEQDPGSNWAVSISGSPVTVAAGSTGNATVTNTLQSGALNVVTSVDWGTIEPILSQTFEICVSGPSLATPDCQSADYNGSTLIWPDLLPGIYTVVQDGSAAWDVTVTGNPAAVAVNQTASVFIDYAVTLASMVLTVSADKTQISTGETVTFSHVVENTGNSAISELSVAGSACEPISYIEGDTNSDGKLSPTESWLFQCQAVVDADTTHRATATGLPAFGGLLSSNRAAVAVDVLPVIVLEKTVSPAVLLEPGGVFTYHLSLQNQSSEPVIITEMSDSFPLSPACLALIGTPLVGGTSVSCSYGIEHIGSGEFLNVSTITVVDDDGNRIVASDSAVATVVDQPSSMTVTYSSPPSAPGSGSVVQLTVIVRNTSLGDDITITALDDSLVGNLSAVGGSIQTTTCALPQTLPPRSTDGSDTYTCAVDLLVEGEEGTLLTHTLTAKATDDDGGALEEAATTSILIYDETTQLIVDLVPESTTVAEPGGPVAYRVTITNKSATAGVTINQLLSSAFGDLSTAASAGGPVNDTSCTLPLSLSASESYACSFVVDVTGEPAVTHTSSVIVSGIDENQKLVSTFDQVTVEIIDVPSAIALSATADVSQLPESGGDVHFDVVIQNRSVADTITIAALVDSLLGNKSGGCDRPISQPLAPGVEVSCHYTGTIMGDAGQPFLHEIVASGVDDDGYEVEQKTNVTFEFSDIPSQMSLTYQTDKESVPSIGEQVAYTVEVRNDSLADSMRVLSLGDSYYGNVADSTNTLVKETDCRLPQLLTPGQPYLCTFHAMVSGELGELRSSQITAVVQDDDQVSLSDVASTSVTIAEPIVNATKSAFLVADADDIASPGDRLRYLISVNNRGNAAASDVILTDILGQHTRLLGGSVIASQGVVTSGNDNAHENVTVVIGTIESGANVSVHFDVLIAPELPDSVTSVSNQALITGENFPSTSTDAPGNLGPTVTIVRLVPRLQAEKSATLDFDANGDGLVAPGDSVAYAVTVFNTGLATANNIVLDDLLDSNVNMVGGSVSTTQGEVISGNGDGDSLVQVNLGQLEPGASATVRFVVQVALDIRGATPKIENQAVITADDLSAVVSDDPSTPAPNDATVTALNAQPLLNVTMNDLLLLDKDGDRQFSDRDVLVYKVVITNKGSGTAPAVWLLDALDPNTLLLAGTVQTDQGEVILGNGFTDDGASDNEVEVAIGDILPGESVSVSFQAEIQLLDKRGSRGITNQAVVRMGSSLNTDGEVHSDDPSVEGQHNATFTPINPGPLLLLTNEDFLFIDADEDSMVSPGDTLLYRIIIENVGTEAAASISVTDRPDPNTALIFNSVRSDLGVVVKGNAEGDNEVVVEIDSLASGEKATVSLLVKILDDASSSLVRNQAEARFGNNPGDPSGQSILPSDDPSTPAIEDVTITVMEGRQALYLPLMQTGTVPATE